MKRFINFFAVLLSTFHMASCQQLHTDKALQLKNEYDMNPIGKNLNKLSKVPFFLDFTTEQLQWVDANTDEYGFSKGQEIPTKDKMQSVYWILLYGSWDIETNNNGLVNKTHVNTLGSWFQLASNPEKNHFSSLTASGTSYILMVPEAKMKEMKVLGFPIPAELKEKL